MAGITRSASYACLRPASRNVSAQAPRHDIRQAEDTGDFTRLATGTRGYVIFSGHWENRILPAFLTRHEGAGNQHAFPVEPNPL